MIMSVESLLNAVELDNFDDRLAPPVYETDSQTKSLVLTLCYGRGKPLKDISIPRLPAGVPARLFMPIVDMMPYTKRAGRGRARMLASAGDDFIPLQKTNPRPVTMLKPVPKKQSLFAIPSFGDEVAQYDEIYLSDEEHDGCPKIGHPSKPSIINHPFGKRPAKRKDPFNVRSADDFPTLGGPSLTDSTPSSISSNPAAKSQFFPPLPPRLSKKETICEIVFKPMKDKKSKKKRKVQSKIADDQTKNVEKTKSHNFERSISETSVESQKQLESDYADSVCDGTSVCDQNSSYNSQISTESECDAISVSEHVPLDVLEMSGDSWQTRGCNVVQIDGIKRDSIDESMTEMQEFVSTYGKVVNFEKKNMKSGKISLRVQYATPEGSEFAVSCLHDADGLFPDTILQCYMVEE